MRAPGIVAVRSDGSSVANHVAGVYAFLRITTAEPLEGSTTTVEPCEVIAAPHEERGTPASVRPCRP